MSEDVGVLETNSADFANISFSKVTLFKMNAFIRLFPDYIKINWLKFYFSFSFKNVAYLVFYSAIFCIKANKIYFKTVPSIPALNVRALQQSKHLCSAQELSLEAQAGLRTRNTDLIFTVVCSYATLS